MDSDELIVGVDAGTSVMKAVAFNLQGKQIQSASLNNTYRLGLKGEATQDMHQTWEQCVEVLKLLSSKIDNYKQRVLCVSITGQGDGTWLLDRENKPISDAWLWLDSRAYQITQSLKDRHDTHAHFTGTGLSASQQGAQLLYMHHHNPDLLKRADVAMHCKDWLYLNLTGVRATDPSEACFSFGDFRTGCYGNDVIENLGLSQYQHLLPDIVDGMQISHPLTPSAAEMTGLKSGTPVTLAYVDIVMSSMGAGMNIQHKIPNIAGTILGSTGIHMKTVEIDKVNISSNHTGYTIRLPMENYVAQLQTNMSATLNFDWILNLAADLFQSFGLSIKPTEFIPHIETWLEITEPGKIIYHPYISLSGERGPFINAEAKASFIGLSSNHRYPDLFRAIVDGLAMAMLDCYTKMKFIPSELRLSGGAARSKQFRKILASTLNVPVRYSNQEEAGAAGAAMVAAVKHGIYHSMFECIDEWSLPRLSAAEVPDNQLHNHYSILFSEYQSSVNRLAPTWGYFKNQ